MKEKDKSTKSIKTKIRILSKTWSQPNPWWTGWIYSLAHSGPSALQSPSIHHRLCIIDDKIWKISKRKYHSKTENPWFGPSCHSCQWCTFLCDLSNEARDNPLNILWYVSFSSSYRQRGHLFDVFSHWTRQQRWNSCPPTLLATEKWNVHGIWIL